MYPPQLHDALTSVGATSAAQPFRTAAGGAAARIAWADAGRHALLAPCCLTPFPDAVRELNPSCCVCCVVLLPGAGKRRLRVSPDVLTQVTEVVQDMCGAVELYVGEGEGQYAGAGSTAEGGRQGRSTQVELIVGKGTSLEVKGVRCVTGWGKGGVRQDAASHGVPPTPEDQAWWLM
jgi:hypothetical protein